MSKIKVIVASSNDQDDCWIPWTKLKDKYWPEAEATIITGNKPFTARLSDEIKLLDDEYIILMRGDHFIRQPVNTARIEYALTQIKKHKKAAAFNFELAFRKTDKTSIAGFGRQKPCQMYNHSCQPSLWRRAALIDELEKVISTAFTWETTPDDGQYEYYMNTEGIIIDVGYRYGVWAGLRDGKWVRDDMVQLNEKEQLGIDFSKRGFFM